MRINFDRGAPPVPEGSRTETSRQPAGATVLTANTVLASDQAQFSGVHLEVQALAAQAVRLPEVRLERVQALRQVLLGGSYYRTPDEVAGAVLWHMINEPAA